MEKPKNTSLLFRALTAVLLTIGFYGLALAIAGGLLFLVYAQAAYFDRINSRLTLFALFGAGAILWSILPRIDRFIPPGPRLAPNEFPLLFKEIREVASLTQQKMPRDVYLVPDVNAFVTERGGMMGIGKRRVMGIGLGLLKLLNVSELRSVLAHEFGHYYGGDTALAPWVYKTRAAIIRTVVNVGRRSSLLRAPFVGYAKIFLRITNTISRQQEYSADGLAARKVGKQATINGLKKIHRYAQAFGTYWQKFYLPVINRGYRPSLLNGFEHFLATENVSQKVESSYEEELSQGKADPYDTHPSLKERLAALEKMPEGDPSILDEPALSLFQNIDDLEGRILLAIASNQEKVRTLKPLRWVDVAETIYLPTWQDTVQTFAEALQGITIGSLPEHAKQLKTLFSRFVASGWRLPPNVKAADVPPQIQFEICNTVIGSALATTLLKQGWELQTGVGEDVVLTKGAIDLNPFHVFIEMATEKLSKEVWQNTCAEAGIYALDLGGEANNA